MTIITLIAAVDALNGLGKNNQLLCHLPADLKHFKSLTTGKPIIMGRKTYESIGKALPDRINIVLSHGLLVKAEIIAVNSVETALEVAQDFPEVMVIGGAGLYRQMISRADRIYLTRIHHQFEADVYFPEIDDQQWHCLSRETRLKDEKNPYDMTFCYYEKLHSNPYLG